MRFSSDKQRKAAFANMMSLYYDPESKRIRSTEYPQVDFKLVTRPGVDREEFLDRIEEFEPYFGGIERFDLKRKSVPRGRLGTYYKRLTDDDYNTLIEHAEDKKRFLIDEVGVDPSLVDQAADRYIGDLDKRMEAERPRVIVSQVGDLGWGEYYGGRRTLAHELGHHADFEDRGKGYATEPVADSIAEELTGVRSKRKYPKSRIEFGKEQAEYAIALQKEKTPSFEELESYVGEDEIQ